MTDSIDDFEGRMAEYRPGEWSNPFDEIGCPVCGRDVVSWATPSSAFGTSDIELAGTPDHCQRGATMFFHEANVEVATLYGMHITGDTDCLGEGDALFRHTPMSKTDTNTDDEQTDESEEWTTMTITSEGVDEGEPDGPIEDVDVDAAELVAELEDADDKAPLADGATVHIHAADPLRVTRAGTTYRAQDIDDEGAPVGDPWALSEGAVRGLLRRHDWTRVEATASVRGGDDE